MLKEQEERIAAELHRRKIEEFRDEKFVQKNNLTTGNPEESSRRGNARLREAIQALGPTGEGKTLGQGRAPALKAKKNSEEKDEQ